MTRVIRWNPFCTLQSQLDRLFDDMPFRAQPGDSSLTAWVPSVDIYETPNELVLEADLPGVNEKALDVQVEDHTLTVRGEREFENKVSEEDYMRLERSYGAFSRSFSLPQTVKTEGVQAEYRNGVLTVRLPKREEAKPKQIKVSVNSAR